MRSIKVILAVLLACSGMAIAQKSALVAAGARDGAKVAAAVDTQPSLHERAPRYKLQRGDSFQLQFAYTPDFDQVVRIQPDGYITLKSAGTIVAAGLTIPELTTAVEHAYDGILNKPLVTVDLKDFEQPFFIVGGQVGKPGKYDLRADLTVTEGVAIAGGFTKASKHSQVVLFRPDKNGMAEARLINVKKMLNNRDLAEDIHLRPGDMIFVPKNTISKIEHFLPTSSLGLYGYPGF
jgi:polysaccharide export outer membrane protein